MALCWIAEDPNPSLAMIIDDLDSMGPDEALWAVSVLGDLGPVAEPAIPVLETILAESNPRMRQAAQWSLEKIRQTE